MATATIRIEIETDIEVEFDLSEPELSVDAQALDYINRNLELVFEAVHSAVQYDEVNLSVLEASE